ncbi:TPA: response regulator [Photobacterium damselae]|uniref:response regulator n=1 Tax=Photobacterium damselae TaxID=38293 RepID=UPI000DA0660D|nr:response regulator transcription factor [Photobacterium damselae]MCG3815967.1 response regulator transcription factor [Photobacterium damselae]NVO74470.1 response regulator transcription factor [Photobacterium damselae subsp. damselae]USR75082.1 response regulator transcription factor [Photobacterium damselae]SPY29494.1 Transcriptional regulatory protein OmpR [Photobacterium damselae]
MSQGKKVLVVDDDQEIRELLDEYLTKSGFHVVTAAEGEEMKRKLAAGEPDLILLDVMMPGDDGFTLCQHIRKTSDVPIIMLTAVSDEMDQIIGLELGADDYIAKPFSPRQLMARIKALLRRVKPTETQQVPATPKFIRFANWRLDTSTHTLYNLEKGHEHELTGGDYALLMLFLSRPNEILDRDTISYATRGREVQASERGVDVALSRLRQRLGDKGRTQRLIKTSRGNGYIFTADVSYES